MERTLKFTVFFGLFIFFQSSVLMARGRMVAAIKRNNNHNFFKFGLVAIPNPSFLGDLNSGTGFFNNNLNNNFFANPFIGNNNFVPIGNGFFINRSAPSIAIDPLTGRALELNPNLFSQGIINLNGANGAVLPGFDPNSSTFIRQQVLQSADGRILRGNVPLVREFDAAVLNNLNRF